MDRSRAALVWRAVFAVVGWAALGLQYGLMISGQPAAEVGLTQASSVKPVVRFRRAL